MNQTAIQVERLSKRYHIGRTEIRHDMLREAVAASLRNLAARVARGGRRPDDTIWALKDVSFEVEEGTIIGVIGRNGAGKSTLLKILSQITEPTSGRAILRGRVGSLLEVGTGFHPELTGRENVYLSGALLGMRRHEIDRRFDEIVAFSGIERFIDTPIKRYSSGMNVRLGFAVAAHLEPEILLIDEVLAVGDVAFQRKSLAKMNEIGKRGRTVLFVSHNMMAMQRLCEEVIWIDGGRIQERGSAASVIQHYLQHSAVSVTSMVWPERAAAPGNESVRLRSVAVHPQGGQVGDLIDVRTPFVVKVDFWNQVAGAKLYVHIKLVTSGGVVVFASSPVQQPGYVAQELPVGRYQAQCEVPGDLLNAGDYYLRVVMFEERRVIYQHDESLMCEIQDSPDRRASTYGAVAGVVRPLLQWETIPVDEPEAIQ